MYTSTMTAAEFEAMTAAKFAAEDARLAEIRAVEKRMSKWHPDYCTSSSLVARAERIGLDAARIAGFKKAALMGWDGRWVKAAFVLDMNKAAQS